MAFHIDVDWVREVAHVLALLGVVFLLGWLAHGCRDQHRDRTRAPWQITADSMYEMMLQGKLAWQDTAVQYEAIRRTSIMQRGGQK